MTNMITEAELGCAGVMGALEAGDAFIITRSGTPVAELRPIREQRNVSTSELRVRLARFAGAKGAAAEQAETETAFGEDRLDD